MPFSLRRLDYEDSAVEVDANEDGVLADMVFSEAGLTHDRIEQSIVATDMDNTMFRDVPDQHILGDLGVLVFLEKLADPTFWQFSVDSFKRLLFPDKYKQCAVDHSRPVGGRFSLASSDCQRLLALAEDVVELYAVQKKLVNTAREDQKNGHGIVVDIHTPIVNEFALKMIEFDRLIKIVEQPLVDAGEARLLMRTRFFAGKNRETAKDLTRGIMERSRDPDYTNHLVELSVNEECVTQAAESGSGIEYRQRIKDIDPKSFRRVVSVNENVRQLIARLSIEGQAYTSVVSANLVEIAEEAVIGSVYANLVSRVVASRLKSGPGANGLFGPDFIGKAINGRVKEAILTKLEKQARRELRVAIGDSVRGDLPMGLKAIRNGGIFVVTGSDFETIQREFRPPLERATQSGTSQALQRTWALSY